ncbi:hypothetical protein EDL98_04165 [Ornithobacterium rhinotracheale]|nr:hypothetical protein [Ornithobacterium rhinotracheale]
MTSCSSDNSNLIADFLPQEINSFGDFIWVAIILNVVIFVFSLGEGRVGGIVASLIVWACVVYYRDYGFLMVTLLFLTPIIINVGLAFVFSILQRKE